MSSRLGVIIEQLESSFFPITSHQQCLLSGPLFTLATSNFRGQSKVHNSMKDVTNLVLAYTPVGNPFPQRQERAVGRCLAPTFPQVEGVLRGSKRKPLFKSQLGVFVQRERARALSMKARILGSMQRLSGGERIECEGSQQLY